MTRCARRGRRASARRRQSEPTVHVGHRRLCGSRRQVRRAGRQRVEFTRVRRSRRGAGGSGGPPTAANDRVSAGCGRRCRGDVVAIVVIAAASVVADDRNPSFADTEIVARQLATAPAAPRASRRSSPGHRSATGGRRWGTQFPSRSEGWSPLPCGHPWLLIIPVGLDLLGSWRHQLRWSPPNAASPRRLRVRTRTAPLPDQQPDP